jgi:hypothetical protein
LYYLFYEYFTANLEEEEEEATGKPVPASRFVSFLSNFVPHFVGYHYTVVVPTTFNLARTSNYTVVVPTTFNLARTSMLASTLRRSSISRSRPLHAHDIFFSAFSTVVKNNPTEFKTEYMTILETGQTKFEASDLTNLTALGVRIHARDIASLELPTVGVLGTNTRMRRRRSYVLNPRREFIVVNFGTIKAILVKNVKLVLFETDKSPMVEEWGVALQTKIPHFVECVESGMSVSFELGVLEEILDETSALFDRRLRLIKPLVKNLVKSSPDEQEGALQRLGPLEDALKVYEMETREARECLRSLLENDEDLHALVAHTDDALHAFDPLKMTAEQSATVASVELLLESYVMKMSRQLDTAFYFQNQLNTWRNIMSMSSEMRRNQILTYSLQTSIAAVSLGASSMVAGIMGMNLSHGLEESPNAFWAVAGSLTFGTVAFQVFSNNYLLGANKTQRFQEEAKKIAGVKSLLVENSSRLDDAVKLTFDALDGVSSATEKFGNKINEEEFSEIFMLASQQSSNKEKLEEVRENATQLFRLLDTDGSGSIDRMEIAHK